uniref:Uncharacterized protein n=1 Tax=Syphacia muris TaxID=451379 RepID=A0A0N5AB62_9BILA
MDIINNDESKDKAAEEIQCKVSESEMINDQFIGLGGTSAVSDSSHEYITAIKRPTSFIPKTVYSHSESSLPLPSASKTYKFPSNALHPRDRIVAFFYSLSPVDYSIIILIIVMSLLGVLVLAYFYAS